MMKCDKVCSNCIEVDLICNLEIRSKYYYGTLFDYIDYIYWDGWFLKRYDTFSKVGLEKEIFRILNE